jgi:hypothetical protein
MALIISNHNYEYIAELSILLILLTSSMTVIAQENDNIQHAQEAYHKAWNETLNHSDAFLREHTLFLNEAIRDIPPGKALDVAMGEGHNTLFLARNG